MPRYDRQCSVCGERYETVERMHAPSVCRCRVCGARAARRVPSTPALVTDTSISPHVKRLGRLAGYRLETRHDIARMESDGVVFADDRDIDLCNRRRGKAAKEPLENAIRQEREKRRIRVRSR